METNTMFPHEHLPVYSAAQAFRVLVMSFDSLTRCPAIRRQLDRAALRVMLSLAEVTVTTSESRKRRVLESAMIACAKSAVLADAATDSGALSEGERAQIHAEALRLMHAVARLGNDDEPAGEGDPGTPGGEATISDGDASRVFHGPAAPANTNDVPATSLDAASKEGPGLANGAG